VLDQVRDRFVATNVPVARAKYRSVIFLSLSNQRLAHRPVAPKIVPFPSN
jgi:hypothetical protein